MSDAHFGAPDDDGISYHVVNHDDEKLLLRLHEVIDDGIRIQLIKPVLQPFAGIIPLNDMQSPIIGAALDKNSWCMQPYDIQSRRDEIYEELAKGTNYQIKSGGYPIAALLCCDMWKEFLASQARERIQASVAKRPLYLATLDGKRLEP